MIEREEFLKFGLREISERVADSSHEKRFLYHARIIKVRFVFGENGVDGRLWRSLSSLGT